MSSASSMAARSFSRGHVAWHGVFEVQPGLILTEMTAPSKGKYDALIAEGMTATCAGASPKTWRA